MAETTKRTVVKAALKVVRLDKLNVDSSYQREVKSGHKRIIAEFNEDALGIPLVGERSDGSLWIVDGQQRIAALRKLGHKEVRAEVFASDGPEHEATVFKLVNMRRIKLTPAEEFKALLGAHDPLAWQIKEMVESLGYKLALSRKSSKTSGPAGAKMLSCVNTLLSVAKHYGIDHIKFALTTADKAWPDDPKGVVNTIISGLSLFYHRRDKLIDEEKFLTRMQTTTPYKLQYAAAQVSVGSTGSGRCFAMAEVIDKLYDKRIVKRKSAGEEKSS